MQRVRRPDPVRMKGQDLTRQRVRLLRTQVEASGGGGGPPSASYLRPDGTSFYLRPDGTSFYLRP